MAKLEVKEFTDAELLKALSDSKAEIFKLRFQHATGQLTNTSSLPSLRKDIARLETEVRSREILAAEALYNSEGEA